MIAILPLLIPLCLLLPLFIIGRSKLVKRYKEKYELSLISGDEASAKRLGLKYYHMLSESDKQRKGIVDIEVKIEEEFQLFNSIGMSKPYLSVRP